MTENKYTVFLVPTTSHALKGERLLKRAGCECRLIPVPRHLSSDCGVCVRVKLEDRKLAQEILLQGNLDIGACHDVP